MTSQKEQLLLDLQTEADQCEKEGSTGITDLLRSAIREIKNLRGEVAALQSEPASDAQTAKQHYDAILIDPNEEPSAIERLRYFLSFALNGQDWLDVEPFIDALSPPVQPAQALSDEVKRALEIIGGDLQTSGQQTLRHIETGEGHPRGQGVAIASGNKNRLDILAAICTVCNFVRSLTQGKPK